jgi:6-pyruvoyltetrahydropterin/6-carboxytetrahydropterin synthase
VNVHLEKALYFEAAHSNPAGTEAQQRLHGHNYRIDFIAAGAMDPEVGWLIDFGDIKAAFAPVYEHLDHRCLNDIDGLPATTLPELERWVFEQLAPRLPCLRAVRITIQGDLAFNPIDLPPDPVLNLPVRRRFTFEAAQSLPQLPAEHKCSKLHGHSYAVEVGARDMARLTPYLRDLYSALDHRCLNDIEGLEQATCEVICRWVWGRLAPEVDGLSVVVVQETESARCAYFGPTGGVS